MNASSETPDPHETPEQRQWLADRVAGLTTELESLTPSDWAEAKRYLPPSVGPMPGYYRFEITPFLREIVDCLGVESPVREVAFMKGVQLGATSGVLENFLGYAIDHVKTAPVMMVTADADLAKLRLENQITPMLQYSELDDLIKSQAERNPRKTGRTDKKLEWIGGGYLLPFGAKNANKLRSIPIQFLLCDEIDGWDDGGGRQGDPLKIVIDRTAAFEGSRKILYISTPVLKGTSRIESRFLAGDQRRYFVCCLKCGHAQTLRFRRENPDTGEVTGIVWEMRRGQLVPDSVRYLCEKCAHPHTNDDKTRLLSPEHGAEWRPTAEPTSPEVRSYHLSALYSPVGMQTWSACVLKWLEAWDTTRNQPRDFGALQVFYNNVLGESFAVTGERVRFEAVSEHRRHEYLYGQVPNKFAKEHAQGAIQLLTCSVDVQKDNLAVAVWGWTRGRRVFLIDYWRFEGDTEQRDDKSWSRLRDLIEDSVYEADDGTRYRIALTLVDSGYRTERVYEFCSDYDSGVYPIKGQELPPKRARVKEFSEFQTPMGTHAYGITVDLYKERWHAALRRQWDRQGMQPAGHFNAPLDATDQQLRELTVEAKKERVDPRTKQRLGWEWVRPSGARNELWDLLVYGAAGVDLIAWNLMVGQLERDHVNWLDFWDLVEEQKLFLLK